MESAEQARNLGVISRIPGSRAIRVRSSARHCVELVVGGDAGEVGVAVGQCEQGGDRADVPDLVVAEAQLTHLVEILRR